MTKEERILRFKYPGRTEFTREELLEARRVLSHDDVKDDSAQRLPTKFVEFGESCMIFGRRYVCVPAAKDILTDPCLGCDIKDLNCTSRVPQCSPFDRRDGKRAWFKLVK